MRVLPVLATLAAALAVRPAPVSACGGCFAPPETITAVESHRMVVSLSPERTTLWDQIRYSGNPRDFVWVLPVPSAAAQVELADPTFFDELEAQTAPRVSSPPLSLRSNCAAPPFASDAEGDPGGGTRSDEDSEVTVYNEETVGPYETVTIGSEDAFALHAWLTANGYRVPDETLPTIAWYVERQSVFVVLRLAPGEGVDAMQPVRVRYPGYMARFPLRMVTVGASGTVDLTLWVVAEQRYEAGNYATLTIDPAGLIWDWDTSTSNYKTLFADTIEGPGAGRGWVNEFAAPLQYLYISAADDLAVAQVGLPYPYLTRLRTSMLVDHLDDDLELRPDDDPSDVWNFFQAERSVGQAPVLQCPDWNGDGVPDVVDDPAIASLSCAAATSARRGELGATLLLAGLTLGVVCMIRRRRARRC